MTTRTVKAGMKNVVTNVKGGGLRGGNAPAAGGGKPEPMQAYTMSLPNALIIRGYAETDQVITQYRENLLQSVAELPNGLYLSVSNVEFNESSVQKVPWETLYNAPVDSPGGVGRRDANAGGYSQGSELYSFEVKVKLIRSVERPAPKSSQAESGDKPA